jgi:FAD-dependent urate hydroxylase
MAARRALVIGGGIGGLSAAIALSRAGIEAHVFERADELTEIGAGLTLWSNATKLLDYFGLADGVARCTSPLEVVQTRIPSGKLLAEVDLSRVSRKLGYDSVGVHRGELLQVLLDAIPEASIHPGARLERFEETDDRCVAFFADGHRETGDVLIGADGIFSTIRTQLFPRSEASYAGYVCWRGITHFDPPNGWPRNSSVRTLGRGLHFGLAQLTPGRYFWYATHNEALDAPEPGGRKATLLRHFGRWHDPIPAALEETPEESMLRHGVYDMRPLKGWGLGPVTLLGDAAHPMRPSLGMGACQAIEDAAVLARHLATEENIPALRMYERHRMRRATTVVRASNYLASTEQRENPLMCRWRDLNTRLVPEAVTRRVTEALFSFDLA